MVTRNDVARKAGVSVAVVSYVMNNKNNVKPETRQKVLKAMEDLHYMPNPTARSLKTQKTNQLAVLVNYLGNPFEAGILLHLEEEARAWGFSLVFQSYRHDRDEALKQLAVDGIILLGQSLREETLRFFARRNTPIVSITKPTNAESAHPVPYVDIDWLESYGKVVRLLIAHGHDDIVFMTHGDENSALHHRTEAFCLAIAEQGLSEHQLHLLYGGGRYENARQCINEIAETGRFPYTAIQCANDLMAIGVLSALKEHGIGVPGQVSLVGSENILMTSETEPAIASIHFPRAEAAKQALILLNQLLQSGDKAIGSIILEGSWVQRGSIKHLPNDLHE